MTTIDIIGVVFVVVISILMSAAYFYAYRPKNKEKFAKLNNFVNEIED